FASSRARWYAAVRPTWPAPRMMMFILRARGLGLGALGSGKRQGQTAELLLASARRPVPSSPVSYRLQVRVRHHQPFGTLALEVDLHARVTALSFEIQDHAFAKLSVPYALAEAHAACRYLFFDAVASRRVDRS